MYRPINRIILYTAVFCMCVLTVHAQYDSLFRIPYPKRYEAINGMFGTDKDSAEDFRIAAILLGKARQQNNERDLLAVEQAVLSVEQFFSVDLPHIEQRGGVLIERAEKINCHPVTAFVNKTLGDYNYTKTHDYVLAFEYYLRAYNYYHNIYKNEFPDMSEAEYSLALAYYKFYDYRNSLKYGRDINGDMYKKLVWFSVLTNDLVGMSYLKLQQYDSAVIYFRKVIDEAPRHHDATARIAWQGIATGNIGLALYQQNKYDEGIPYLLKGEELSTEGKVMDNTASFATCLANIYLAKNDVAGAKNQLQIAREATYISKDLQNYCEVYTALCSFYRRTGDPIHTLQYQDSSLKYKDSLTTIADVNKKYKAEISVADERRSMGEQLAEKEKQKQILVRNGLLIMVLMGMLFILLFYNRKLLTQKYRREQLLAEKQIAETEKQVAETELANVLQQLDNFKNNIAEKNELILTMEKEISGTLDSATIAKLQQSTILTDEQWSNFRQLFEKAHPGFLQKLKEKLPDLTPAEIRFFVLLKLNFTNKEMAAALGVGSEAIRVTWYRLRKKLNLPDEGGIEELVKKI